METTFAQLDYYINQIEQFGIRLQVKLAIQISIHYIISIHLVW